MTEQKKPLVLRLVYSAILGGLLALIPLAYFTSQDLKELEQRVDAVAVEQERTLREAEELLEMLEGLEHDFEAGDPARGGEI